MMAISGVSVMILRIRCLLVMSHIYLTEKKYLCLQVLIYSFGVSRAVMLDWYNFYFNFANFVFWPQTQTKYRHDLIKMSATMTQLCTIIDLWTSIDHYLVFVVLPSHRRVLESGNGKSPWHRATHFIPLRNVRRLHCKHAPSGEHVKQCRGQAEKWENVYYSFNPGIHSQRVFIANISKWYVVEIWVIQFIVFDWWFPQLTSKINWWCSDYLDK